jgi:predicted nucleic acid-binding protein
MGSAVTSPVPAIYVDTNVLLAAYETVGARSDHAFWILRAIEEGEIRGATSELTLAELLPGPVEDGNADLAEAYKQLLSGGPNMDVHPVTRDILIATASLRAGRPGFKLPDAIHCATALHAGCVALVSDDRRIPRNAGISIVRFGPHVMEDIRSIRR